MRWSSRQIYHTSARSPVTFFAIFLLLALTPDPAVGVQTGSDLVLVVDTSKSMRGVGGTANIFSTVLNTCKNLIQNNLRPGDSFTLIQYDEEVLVHPTVSILSRAEMSAIVSLIEHLEANGNFTYTSQALSLALGEAERLAELHPDRKKFIVILTDGINDPPPGASDTLSLKAIAEQYQGRHWFVYQVQLGPSVDLELERATKILEGTVVTDSAGIRLGSLPEIVEIHPDSSRPSSPGPSIARTNSIPLWSWPIGLLAVVFLVLGVLALWLRLRPTFDGDLFLQIESTDERIYPAKVYKRWRSGLYANRDFLLDSELSGKSILLLPQSSVLSIAVKEATLEVEVEGEPLGAGESRVLYPGESFRVNTTNVSLKRTEHLPVDV